jgi:hypothetical protein
MNVTLVHKVVVACVCVVMSSWWLLVAAAYLGLHASAQPPTSPGTLSVGQVFTGQYDDFGDFGGDSLIIKISAADGSILRLNTVGLRFYYPWYNYRALSHPFEGQPRASAPHLHLKHSLICLGPIIYNISGDGQLKYACTSADIVGDVSGYIVRHPAFCCCFSTGSLVFQVVVKRVRGAAGSCRTADQFKVLQDAGALGIVVVDDVQERLSFNWCALSFLQRAASDELPASTHVLAGMSQPVLPIFAPTPPAP